MAAESKAALLAIVAEGKPPIEGKGAYIAELDKGLVPTSDPLYLIGMQVYGYAPAIAESKKADEPAPCIIPFEYMNDFMKDTLMAYGVPEKEAIISADVLIEADKRGIDSHGIGRLKPIYCDRMDADILYPYKEMKTISESDTTAPETLPHSSKVEAINTIRFCHGSVSTFHGCTRRCGAKGFRLYTSFPFNDEATSPQSLDILHHAC